MKAGADFDARHESNKSMIKVHKSHSAKHSALKTAQAKNMAPVDAPKGKDIKR